MVSKLDERFCVYGFCIDYSPGWKVGLSPKSVWKDGDTIFALDSETKVFLSWRPLEEINKKYSKIDEHVQSTINRIKKGSKTKEIKIIRREKHTINSHESISCCVGIRLSSRVTTMLRGDQSPERNICFVHLYCTPSQRSFTIYGSTKPDDFSQLSNLIDKMADSLKCH